MPSAGISMRAASANSSSIREAPSSIEYSVWVCRCTKLDDNWNAPGRTVENELQPCDSSRPLAPLPGALTRDDGGSRARFQDGEDPVPPGYRDAVCPKLASANPTRRDSPPTATRSPCTAGGEAVLPPFTI